MSAAKLAISSKIAASQLATLHAAMLRGRILCDATRVLVLSPDNAIVAGMTTNSRVLANVHNT